MSPPSSSLAAPTRRGWGRFVPRISLRGLMILIAVVAAPVGWLANKIQSQRRAIATIRAAGGWITYDFNEEQIHPRPNFTKYRDEPAAPAWVRRWLGDELFQEVHAVEFTGRFDAPEALEALARFDRLERLTLGEAARVGAGLRHLRGLRRLRTVKVGGPGIDDAAVADVAALPAVRYLEVEGAAATDAGFAHLATMPAVASLSLGRNIRLTDAGLARLLAGLPRLRHVGLQAGSGPLALALPALAEHHPDLYNLELVGSGVADTDLAAVGRMTGLRRLDLSRTAITDAGLAQLRPLGSLTRLTLGDLPGLTDTGLEPVGRIATLEDLDLGTTYISDAGLPALAPLAHLKRLCLAGTDVTDAGLAALDRLPTLESLDLDANPQITDAGIVAASRLPSLLQIHVGPTGTTSAAVGLFLTGPNGRFFGQSHGINPGRRLPPRTPPTPASQPR